MKSKRRIQGKSDHRRYIKGGDRRILRSVRSKIGEGAAQAFENRSEDYGKSL